MTDVMKGITVLEIAEYGMVPAAGAILSDWGANVLKVEHAERGDSIRGLTAWKIPPGAGGFTYLWEMFNRGKRSIGIDIGTPDGRKLILEIAKTADVVLTNFLPAARRKLGIDVEAIKAVNPRIVYARGSAHGVRGAEAEKGGFDGTAYWLRCGIGIAATPPGSKDLMALPAPAFGDIQTGLALAGGIAAALFHRERTGEGVVVDISLMSSGMWAMQGMLVGCNVSGQTELPHPDRNAAPNPVANQYRTKDGRFIALAMLQTDRYWADFCRAIGREAWVSDARYATMEVRNKNNLSCIKGLDQVFAERSLDEWCAILSTQEGQWSVVQRAWDLNCDQQARDNGYLQTVDYGDGRQLTLVPAPIQFDEVPARLRPAPTQGEHTEEVLLELGRDWDEIGRLKDAKAVG